MFWVFKLQKREGVESFRLKRLPEFLKTNLKIFASSISYSKTAHAHPPSTREPRADGLSPTDTQNLLDILKELRRKITENKHADHYQLMRTKVKSECTEYENIDKLREIKTKVSKEIETLKLESSSLRNKANNLGATSEACFGDYRLKSLPDYQVSDNDRLSVQKHEAQILQFEHLVHERLGAFNQKLKAFKTRKATLLEKIKQTGDEVGKINVQLNLEPETIHACFYPELEQPDNLIAVTPADFAEHL